jgi:organic hydroperoxide reductase OsmC/OhrA
MSVDVKYRTSATGGRDGNIRTEDGNFEARLTTPKGEAQQLVETAHQICPYSNATRNNIDVHLSLA